MFSYFGRPTAIELGLLFGLVATLCYSLSAMVAGG